MKFHHRPEIRNRVRGDSSLVEDESFQFDGRGMLARKMPSLFKELESNAEEDVRINTGTWGGYLLAIQKLTVFFPEIRAQSQKLDEIALVYAREGRLDASNKALLVSLKPSERQRFQDLDIEYELVTAESIGTYTRLLGALMIIYPAQYSRWRQLAQEYMPDEIHRIKSGWKASPLKNLLAWHDAVDLILVCPQAKAELQDFFKEDMRKKWSRPNLPKKPKAIIDEIFNAEVVLGNSTIFINDQGKIEYQRFSPPPAPPVPLPYRSHL